MASSSSINPSLPKFDSCVFEGSSAIDPSSNDNISISSLLGSIDIELWLTQDSHSPAVQTQIILRFDALKGDITVKLVHGFLLLSPQRCPLTAYDIAHTWKFCTLYIGVMDIRYLSIYFSNIYILLFTSRNTQCNAYQYSYLGLS
jgi:hypothetical protein